MIKSTYKKFTRSRLTLFFYVLLMFGAFWILYHSTFKILFVTHSYYVLISACFALFASSILLWLTVWLKDPGFIK